MPRTLSVLILLLCNFHTFAQQYSVNGKVKDGATSRPVAGIVLCIMQRDSLLSRILSDTEGRFSFPIGLYEKATSIKITSLSYRDFKYIKKTGKPPYGKNLFLHDFMLDPKGIDLGEVTIRRKRRYRDTTVIDLSGKVFDRNIMINDLFSSNGFSRDASGQLYYKRLPVAEVVVNGQDFFGRNNMEVFKNLPALTIDHLTITETDIDSVTNITLLRPAIKLNLSLKEKYNKGFFGSFGTGAGSGRKYLATGEISAYKKNRQLSLEAGSNNINNVSGPFFEPLISFAPDGSRTETSRIKVTYRDLYFKNRLEVNVLISAKDIQRTMESVSEQRDGGQDQNSRTVNNNRSRSHMLDAGNLSLAFKIDSLNSLKAFLLTEFNKTSSIDSIYYRISNGNSTSFSSVNKTRKNVYQNTISDITYQHNSAKKKGQSISLDLHLESRRTDVNEEGKISEVLDMKGQEDAISGIRYGTENIFSSTLAFTEPLNQEMYLRFLSSYKRETINYSETQLQNVAVKQINGNAALLTNYAKIGLNIRKTGEKITVDASVFAMLGLRQDRMIQSKQDFNTIDVDLNAEYKLSGKRFINARIQRSTNYPIMAQLTSINSSYDRISQTLGNPVLTPEIKNHFDISYDLYKSDSLNFGVYSSADLYRSKFGMNISAGPNRPQLSYIDNLGNVVNTQFGFTASGYLAGLSISSRTSLNYQEFQSIFNNNILQGRSSGISQSFSANAAALKKKLSFQPTLSASYMKNTYGNQTTNQYSLTYLDKVGFSWGKYELAIYPMINFNYNLSRNMSFAANATIKKSIFKSFGKVWVQAYDIFNSFKYVNNINSGTYIRSVSYSNLQRYFLVGCSIRFNSMKQ
jgi:hypothetical protein